MYESLSGNNYLLPFSAVLVYNVIGVVAAGEQVCYRILVDVCSALHTIAAI